MAENRIQYSTRTYQECKDAITELTRRYYSDIYENLNDASVGQWLLEVTSDVYDALSYNIDRAYQETNIDSANSRSSLMNLARTAGVKVPGAKAAIVEVELSCRIPLYDTTNGNIAVADEHYAPYIQRGTLFSDGMNTFELAEDVDFKQQFNSDGISNRQMVKITDSNGVIVGYRYKKLAIARACQSKVFKRFISASDIEPFMSITIEDNNVLGVESILLKQGQTLINDPSLSEYYVEKESYEDKTGRPVQRFFEVDNLIDQYRFGYEEEISVSQDGTVNYYNPVWEAIDSIENPDGTYEPVRMAVRGKWKRLKNKFVTEYLDNGKLKITFGSGLRNIYGQIPDNAADYTQYRMSRMLANDSMGVLPEPNTTMYILYTTGGGNMSNIGANTLTNIISLSYYIEGNCDDGADTAKKNNVRNSITVTNPSQSYGGKDAPSNDEVRNMIKFITGAQNRCVTLNDYYARIIQMPAKYGVPFRVGVVEENNKVVVYSLGMDYNGQLTSVLSETVAENMKNYLSKYKMINDLVEIRSGRVINVAFDIDVYMDPAYDRNDVTRNIINLVTEYMDVRRRFMGEDIFIGDMEKDISKLDGVVNLIDLRCYNRTGDGYSTDQITQPLVTDTSLFDTAFDGTQIDLAASDKTLFADAGSMFEVRFPQKDIRVNVRMRS